MIILQDGDTEQYKHLVSSKNCGDFFTPQEHYLLTSDSLRVFIEC